MPILSDFPYSPGGSGAPEYSYDGESVFQAAPQPGVKWRLILLTSGTLTFTKNCRAKRFSAQGGGGGGGAGNGAHPDYMRYGSDGEDGAIETLENQTFSSTTGYFVTIGTAGRGGTDRAGYGGGDTLVEEELLGTTLILAMGG